MIPILNIQDHETLQLQQNESHVADRDVFARPFQKDSEIKLKKTRLTTQCHVHE